MNGCFSGPTTLEGIGITRTDVRALFTVELAANGWLVRVFNEQKTPSFTPGFGSGGIGEEIAKAAKIMGIDKAIRARFERDDDAENWKEGDESHETGTAVPPGSTQETVALAPPLPPVQTFLFVDGVALMEFLANMLGFECMKHPQEAPE